LAAKPDQRIFEQRFQALHRSTGVNPEQARRIQPWDRNLPKEAAGPLFVEHSLTDTEAVPERRFTALSETDIIELTVLDPVSKQKIMAGMLHRARSGRCVYNNNNDAAKGSWS
jgi:hypothetical protein